MIIYIAGPITGVFDPRPNFTKAEKELVKRGHIVINPSVLPGTGLSDYMAICRAMIDQSEAVYFLKGYSSSEGAKQELAYAIKNGLKLYFEDPKE
jgi:hypothetical protein